MYSAENLHAYFKEQITNIDYYPEEDVSHFQNHTLLLPSGK